MKKVKLSGKLSLNKETIASLNNTQMGGINAGSCSWTQNTNCNTYCDSCNVCQSRTLAPTCFAGCGTGSTCC